MLPRFVCSRLILCHPWANSQIPLVIPLPGRLRACWPEWAKLKPNALSPPSSVMDMFLLGRLDPHPKCDTKIVLVLTSSQINWIHPSYKLAGQVLRVQHLRLCQAHGTVILPGWEHAPWWPSVLSLLKLPTCSLQELGPAPTVLCFPDDSRYGLHHLPRSYIIALQYNLPSHQDQSWNGFWRWHHI